MIHKEHLHFSIQISNFMNDSDTFEYFRQFLTNSGQRLALKLGQVSR